MALSAAAEAKIRALVDSGINFSLHVANSDHFDEDSAYDSARAFGKGKDGLGPCSFFMFDDDGYPSIHKTSPGKIAEPAPFSKVDADGFTLTGKPLQAAKQAHKDATDKFGYRTRKNNLRNQVEYDLQESWDANGNIDKHALIKAFLLQKKSTLDSRDGPGGRIAITGSIPSGFIGYVITPGTRKSFEAYEFTTRMAVILGGGTGNPQVITAYPIRM